MSKKRILIIDDDPDLRLGLKIRLAANDYETYSAADGIGAVAEACKMNPDVVILDLGIPDGDGFCVMERFRTDPSLAKIPVIVLSARDGKGNKNRALEAGARAYLQKPASNEALLALVRELVEYGAGGAPKLEGRGLS